MDKEFNLPAFYSGLLLAVIAFLLKELGVSSIAKQRLSWILLSKIFLFLAIDEIFQIHELFVIANLRQYVHPSLSSIWIIPYGALSALFLFKFGPFFLRLGRATSRLSFISGIIYISGAIGIEALNSWLVMTGQISLSGFWYEAISGVEELLEMFGLIIFLYALLRELLSYHQSLNFRFLILENQEIDSP